jgi:hypothetical protein
MMRWYALVQLLLASLSTMAQINESDTAKFQLKASVSGNYQHGNVNLFTLRSKLDASTHVGYKWVFKTQNASLYQELGTVKADNDIFSRNYLYYQPWKTLYPYAIAYVSTNYRRKINSRVFSGLGVTYQVLHKTNSTIKFSASAVYETSKFSNTIFNQHSYDGSSNIHLWRGTLYTNGWWYLSNNRLRLYYDAFYQPAFNNTSNYRTQVDVGVDVPIWRGLSFSCLYTLTHEAVVPINVKEEDTILTFGVNYQLKKAKAYNKK